MKFIFYYEYKDIVGGITSLYVTLFEEMVKRNVNFIFFNYTDGIVNKQLKNKGIKVPLLDIEEFNWTSLSDIVSADDVIVLTSFDECFAKFLKINPKVIYYNVNELLGEISRYKFGLNLRFLGRRLVSKLDESHSLVFMDETGINNAQNKLGYSMRNKYFLPVPIKRSAVNKYAPGSLASGEIRLSYVGRSVVWKMMPLKKILDDLLILSRDFRINFTVIVDSINDMEQFINVDHFRNKNFKLTVLEKVNPNDLPEILLAETDIGFGMGTVLLDYGKIGIPVILVDASKNVFPDNYKYKWSYEIENFCLGKFIESHLGDFDGFEIKEILSEAFADPSYLQKISDKVYNYTNTFHGVSGFVSRLLNYSEKASFRLRDAQPYIIHYSPLHQAVKKIISRSAN
ncbi:hypothetical protein P0M11_02095 [Kaistella sp. PBT33-4]|uniref:hypothetical protein n=1 Tax=Kaistella sp. PBT33-4 TaxID=3032000 RepID=UPI0023D7F369|nr:hypothetical protein [Kaistella sp. PBT33-4]MDF0718781.1 hypothetical protein [Kaistella sp. PBT33-4]